MDTRVEDLVGGLSGGVTPAPSLEDIPSAAVASGGLFSSIPWVVWALIAGFLIYWFFFRKKGEQPAPPGDAGADKPK